jgi:DNA invertase Pin-like site-specific DNA recombinase
MEKGKKSKNLSKRGRNPGPDPQKIAAITTALKLQPNGLWTRELARVTGLKRSTVSFYLNTYLKEEIEDVHGNSRPMRIIKIKKKTPVLDYIR